MAEFKAEVQVGAAMIRLIRATRESRLRDGRRQRLILEVPAGRRLFLFHLSGREVAQFRRTLAKSK
jgi:hypothetical protein